MRLILLLCIMSNIHQTVLAQEMAIPEDYRWKNRIILLFAPGDDNSLLQQQRAELFKDATGITARDLIIFQILPDQLIGQENLQNATLAQSLRDKYHVKEGKFCAILIGKDGSEKLRKDTAVSREELYNVIDAMPMRQREMREDKSKN